MVVYCVEFIQRPDGQFDAHQHFGQHFGDDELLDDFEPRAPYEVYQITGHSIILPKSVVSEEEKTLWLEFLRGTIGHGDTRYSWRRAI